MQLRNLPLSEGSPIAKMVIAPHIGEKTVIRQHGLVLAPCPVIPLGLICLRVWIWRLVVAGLRHGDMLEISR